MFFHRKLLGLLFVWLFSNVGFTQINSSCSLGNDIKTCNSSITLDSKSQLPGTWKLLSGGGTLSNVNSANTSVLNLPEGISTFAWSNNDNSCFDTVLVIIPKIGASLPSIVGSGQIVSVNECRVSFGSILKFNTIGSVLPPTVGNLSSVAYFLYTCQPPLSPNVLQDGCVNKGVFENINNLKNDGVLGAKIPTLNQTYWAVPVLSNDITLKGPQVDPVCQKIGSPIKFTLLNDITYVIKDHCKDGISEITFSGGDAEFFGSKFTISNIVTKKGVFSSNSIGNGEVLTISNLINGETISFDVTDAVGYKISVSYMFPPCPACITSIGYNSSYCRYDTLATPIFYNNAGIGRLSVVPKSGLVWDTISGVVDVKKSIPGLYSVKNLSSKSCVKKDSSFCTINLSDTVRPPVSPVSEVLCMQNPKVGNITSVVAQLITWYDKNGKKLNSDIDPVYDGETYYSTQTINGCESKKVPIKVIAPTIKPPIASAIQFVCKSNKPTLQNLLPKGSNISWYAVPSGGVKLPLNTLLNETKYYASITLNCESQQRVEVTVKFDNPPLPVLSEDTLFYCASKSLTVDSLVPYGAEFLWFAKSLDVIQLKAKDKLEQGTYYVSYVNPATNCQSSKLKVRVFITEILANIQVFEPNCDHSDGLLTSLPSSGSYPYFFQWSTGAKSSAIEMVSAGDFSLKITDNNGCTSDTILTLECRKKISAILTPDGNGKNDFWVVGYSDRYPNVKVLVYNRWGNIVYDSPVPYQDNWDGRSNVLVDQPFVTSGTYFYQIFKTPNSSPESGYIEIVK